MGDGSVLQIAACYVDMARERGGVANIVRRISAGSAALGQKTLLICGDRELAARQGRAGSFELQAGVLQMQVFDQRRHPLLGPTRQVRTFLRGLRHVKAAHVHTCFSAFTERCMLELQELGIPYVFTPHGKLSPAMFGRHGGPKRLWWNWIGRRAVAGAARLAASSPVEADALAPLNLPSQALVIPNGYDADALRAAALQPRVLVDAPYILFLGYLDPRKQPEFAVRAFARSQCRETHKFVLAGPDSYHHGQVVKDAIAREGIADRIVLFGPAYGDDKWQLLQGASCFVLPSQGEGLPVAACEALGARAPLLLSTACNFPEAATSGAGIELGPFEAELWAAAMDQICLDRDRQENMKAAAGRLAHRYTWDAVVSQWNALYDEISTAGRSVALAREGLA